MKALKWCIHLCLLFAVCSCTTCVDKFEPSSYIGTRISMPREVKILSKAPYRIFILLDLVTCPSCELKSLHFWDYDLAHFYELNKDKLCLDIIVVVNTERNDEIDSALSRINTIFPIKTYYDVKEEFSSRFTPPVENQYHCFLVDKSDRILLIGYPYMSKTLSEKYTLAIFGE